VVKVSVVLGTKVFFSYPLLCWMLILGLVSVYASRFAAPDVRSFFVFAGQKSISKSWATSTIY